MSGSAAAPERESDMDRIRGYGIAALPQVDWDRLRPRRAIANGAAPVVYGIALAAVVGYLVGGGNWKLAALVAATPPFFAIAVAAPERTALGLIVILPFLFYPASVGGFSLFLGVPLFGFTGLTLVARQHGSLRVVRRLLPLTAFGVLAAIAIATAGISSDKATAFSRVLYLLLFGWFAFAVVTSLLSGRMTRESIAKAIALSGAVAAVAVLIQFAAQFAVGQQSVIDWLRSMQASFAGEHAASVSTINWQITSLNVVRGIFPFMSPPSAGQYLMLTLIGAMWLRREHKAATSAGLVLQWAVIVLIGAALLATFSRQAWLGAVIGVIALGVSKRRPIWMLAIIVEMFLVFSVIPIPGGHGSFGDYLLTASDTSTTSSATRLDLWNQAFQLIPHHALIGVGPGLYSTLNPSPSHPIYYAHNVFLDETVELGIAGGLAFVALFGLGLASALRRGATLAFSMLTAYVVANLFDDVFFTPRNGLLLAVAFALIASRRAPHPDGTAAAVKTGRAAASIDRDTEHQPPAVPIGSGT
jgi:O-antigen ligase